MNVDQKINLFKEELRNEDLSVEYLFQKHIVDTQCFLFNKILNKPGLEYEIREIVSSFFGVHLNEVSLIGSSKIGYSVSPKKLFKKFDDKFKETHLLKDKSDIDISIVSPDLFEKLSKSLFQFTDSFKIPWTNNEYYNGEKLSNFNVPINYVFFQYYTKGWFRVDFKPNGFEMCRNGKYEDLKRIVLEKTQRKLAVGIYKDWFYYKKYHLDNINKIRLSVKSQIL